ncbi:glycosyltransferase, partial [Ruthenibacterium lactatiformans]|uniref:glycosyltransferase n=1 Tax=Ruthenibacterium lactatiformans TaxID=1550024 RepID=UPI0026DBBDEE
NFDYRMVLNVAEILKDERNIVFQMIGFGSQKDVFESTAKERGLDNIVFLPLEPQEMVPHVYSACSVCLIPLPKGVIGNSVPSKAGLLMACHRVIVTSADGGSEYNKMFEREQIGIACSTDDPQGVADGIIRLRDNPDLREKYADNAQKYGKAVYTRTVNTKLYEDLYRRIGGKA